MRDLGIDEESFNPKILYIFKKKHDENSRSKYHCHDFVSMIYFLSGEGSYNINSARYIVKKGDLIVINPGIDHCRIMDTGQETLELHVGFTDIYVKNLPDNHIISKDKTPVFKPVRYEQDFLKCCEEIISEQEKDLPGCGPLLKSLLMKLIIIFLRENYKHDMDPAVGDILKDKKIISFESYDRVNIVNEIIYYMNENYMNEISLEKISKNIYLSPVYISKIFKEETGESPINYLIQVRLSKALKLLEEGNLTVRAVAKSVGYDDAYHFSKIFKKYYGKPPSKFRK